GTISIGSDADLVLIDLEKEAVVPEKPVYSGTDFSIFAGWKIKGWPILTMLRGSIVAKDGKVMGESGYGRFIPGR
ncbi:dihydropyrimidinase, partial [bacterium]|nr:dihydropyrimidinase [bacterium]